MKLYLAGIYRRFRNKVFGEFREKAVEDIRKRMTGFLCVAVHFLIFMRLMNRQIIITFGDSTTARRLKQGVRRVYGERLKAILKTHGLGTFMINSGAGGSHTGSFRDNSACGKYHALDRLDKEVRKHKPSIVIVQFGLNDSWVDSDDPARPSRIPLDRFVKNIDLIVSTLKKDGARVVLMTPNPLGSLYPDWRKQRLFLYTEAICKAAQDHTTGLVDVWKIFGNYSVIPGKTVDDLLLDSMHPNDLGHQLIAESLAEHLTSS